MNRDKSKQEVVRVWYRHRKKVREQDNTISMSKGPMMGTRWKGNLRASFNHVPLTDHRTRFHQQPSSSSKPCQTPCHLAPVAVRTVPTWRNFVRKPVVVIPNLSHRIVFSTIPRESRFLLTLFNTHYSVDIPIFISSPFLNSSFLMYLPAPLIAFIYSFSLVNQLSISY